MANFRPAVAGIPGVAVLVCASNQRSQDGLGFSLPGVASRACVCRKSAGIPGVAVLVCASNQRGIQDGLGFSLPSSESGILFRKSAGIPGVAVLVCASKRGASFGHAGL